MDDFRMDCEGVWTGYRPILYKNSDGTYSLNFAFDEWKDDAYKHLARVQHFEPPESVEHPEGGLVPAMVVLSAYNLEELHLAIHETMMTEAEVRAEKETQWRA